MQMVSTLASHIPAIAQLLIGVVLLSVMPFVFQGVLAVLKVLAGVIALVLVTLPFAWLMMLESLVPPVRPYIALYRAYAQNFAIELGFGDWEGLQHLYKKMMATANLLPELEDKNHNLQFYRGIRQYMGGNKFHEQFSPITLRAHRGDYMEFFKTAVETKISSTKKDGYLFRPGNYSEPIEG